jgi:hypothetical protein
MSWAEKSCPDAEVESLPPPAKVRSVLRFEHKPARDPALEVSISRMYVEGFFQCLRCFKITHADTGACPKCSRPGLKFFPPSKPNP